MSTRSITRGALGGIGAFLLTGLLFAILSPRSAAQNQPGQGEAAMRGMKDNQPGQPQTVKDLTADQAHAILAAAMQKATELNIKQNIAVVDAGGSLKAFIRMDGAWLGSIDIAIKKAKTSRYFDMPTGEIGKLSQPGKPLYQIEVSNGGLITFPGGVPIKLQDGTIIGAVGVSGSTVENDNACATAGAAVIK
jgi:uncharacterized protein GlcG (DUF336 family)